MCSSFFLFYHYYIVIMLVKVTFDSELGVGTDAKGHVHRSNFTILNLVLDLVVKLFKTNSFPQRSPLSMGEYSPSPLIYLIGLSY